MYIMYLLMLTGTNITHNTPSFPLATSSEYQTNQATFQCKFPTQHKTSLLLARTPLDKCLHTSAQDRQAQTIAMVVDGLAAAAVHV